MYVCMMNRTTYLFQCINVCLSALLNFFFVVVATFIVVMFFYHNLPINRYPGCCKFGSKVILYLLTYVYKFVRAQYQEYMHMHPVNPYCTSQMSVTCAVTYVLHINVTLGAYNNNYLCSYVPEVSFAEITSRKKSAGLLCCSHTCPMNTCNYITVC